MSMVMNMEMQTAGKRDRIKIHNDTVDTSNPVKFVCFYAFIVWAMFVTIYDVFYVLWWSLVVTTNVKNDA